MPGKRARDEDAGLDAGAPPVTDETRKPKKAKHGFRVGPENLPDGAWRRKVTKIKKDLITKAKVKKQYAKIKAEHQKQAAPTLPADDNDTKPADDATTTQETDPGAPVPAQIHPSRQAMLDGPPFSTIPRNQQQEQHQPQDQDQDRPANPHQKHHPRKQRRPDYYTKELAAAERAKQQAEARAAEAARREQEKQTRIAERERYRRAMAKAKTPGRDGKVKIGREGKLLLERVRRVMGES